MHPEVVGPYRIERRLGAGGMGNVYLGIHTDTGLEAAVKVLPASIAREEGFAERFSREIQVLRQLSNRHVVALYQDGATADGSLYYAMEFVDGPTLTTEIQSRRRIPWPEVLELALQAATALKAAHAAGVIHRDLKPSNLMLNRDRTLKLADFGVASLFAASSRLTQTGSVVGTAEYMSPEQARGQRATPRSDLYSLGAVLYAMLTGRPPFNGSTTGEILQKHQFGQFDRPSRFVPAVPRLLDDLVCQLLEKDPAKRPADALVVMRRLEQIRARTEQAEELEDAETPLRPSTAVSDLTALQSSGSAASSETGSDTDAAVGKPATARPSPRPFTSISHALDNLYVLVGLLLLLIFAAVWMLRRSSPGDAERLQTAAELLDQPAGTGWIKARDEFLLPLLAREKSSEQQELLRSWIQQVDDYEFTRSLQPDRRRGATGDDELQRLIRNTFERHRRGETAAAEKQLEAILVLLPAVRPGGHLEPFLTKTLQDWRKSQSQAGVTELLQQLLIAIRQQHPNGNLGPAARNQLEAALELYRDSPAAAGELRQIQQILDGH
jgi:serine/threonine-protein kinase